MKCHFNYASSSWFSGLTFSPFSSPGLSTEVGRLPACPPRWVAVATGAALRRLSWVVVATEAAQRHLSWFVVATGAALRRLSWVVVATGAALRRLSWVVVAKEAAQRRLSWVVVATGAAQRRLSWVVVATEAAQRRLSLVAASSVPLLFISHFTTSMDRKLGLSLRRAPGTVWFRAILVASLLPRRLTWLYQCSLHFIRCDGRSSTPAFFRTDTLVWCSVRLTQNPT